MSDSHDDTTGQGPGSTGDASTSQGSSKPGVKTAQQKSATPPPPPPAAKKAPAQKAPAKKAPAQKSAQKPAQKAPAKKAAPATPTSEQDTVVQPAARPSTAQPAAGSGRPLTAADYATTTRGSAASTSVMPAIRDEPTPGAAPAAAAGSSRSARLRLKHIEPWSVTRLAFVVSVALMIVAVVAVTIFWIVLDLTGVWDQLNGSVTNVLSDDSGNFDVTDYLGLGRLVGLTLVLSAVNVIVMTALATIAAHLYNLAAQLLGGVELTFGED